MLVILCNYDHLRHTVPPIQEISVLVQCSKPPIASGAKREHGKRVAKLVLPGGELHAVGRPSPYQLPVVIVQTHSMVTFSDWVPNVNCNFDGDWAERGQDMRVVAAWISYPPTEETPFGARAAILRMPVGVAPGHGGFVRRNHLVRAAVLPHRPGIDPYYPIAQPPDLIELMAHQYHRTPRPRHVAHLSQAFFLKVDVPDGQDFIHQQNFRLQMRGHRERQPHEHSRGVMLHGRVDEFFQLGESHDFVELSGDLPLAHPQDGPGEIRVFPPRQLRMKPRPYFQQRPHLPVNFRPASGGAGDAGKDFQESGLPRPVASDEAEDFAFANVERDFL